VGHPIDGLGKTVGARDRGTQDRQADAEMLRQQRVTDTQDGLALLGALGIEGDVAFGVEGDGAIVEVRRSDAEEQVVDDHHLGVDQQAALFRAGRDRVIDVKPVVSVDGLQAAEQPFPVRAHDEAFHDSIGHARADDHDLRPVGLPEDLLEQPPQPPTGEVLRLDVDRCPCGAQKVFVETCGFLDGRLPVVARFRAGHRDRRGREVGLQRVRPPVDHGAGRQCLPSRVAPSAPGNVAQVSDDGPLQNSLNVVNRIVALAVGASPQAIVRRVVRCVPAFDGKIHAAHEGDGVVNDDDLLMMRRVCGMVPVEVDVDALVSLPVRAVDQRQRRAGRVDDREAPNEHPHVQVRAALDKAPQQVSERRGVRTILRPETDAGVEIPTEDHDGALRPPERVVEHGVVGLRIDQHGCPARLGHGATVAAR